MLMIQNRFAGLYFFRHCRVRLSTLLLPTLLHLLLVYAPLHPVYSVFGACSTLGASWAAGAGASV